MAFHALRIFNVSGVTSCTAQRSEAECLDVLILGSPEALRIVAQLMMLGPLDAEFHGQQFRLTKFTVRNQGDRGRLVFTATHTPATGFTAS
ncbi:hypothetical protein DES41_10547 [Pseudorhodoferax soli]|uniref:Uncharacterized protein n=1 Tax=Pseudorhodoferax soli TaxID=545864 RepID=A0A368XQ48_9BURK|nr:hypothetical protein DES41_10547 [Pseudorhodoferax soli]